MLEQNENIIDIDEIQDYNTYAEEKTKLVVKHNKLIEYKGRMTSNEIKLFGLIISDIREKQTEQFAGYDVDVTILKEVTKHKDFYNYIKEVALRLEEKRIIVEKINEDEKRETTLMRLINKPVIVEGSRNLRVYIDKDLIPYVMDLKKNFTRYQIENILRLKSSYSVRIYELAKQYESIGTRVIPIQELKEFLGVEEDEYKRFYDFEKWTLKVAKEEINEVTDILIDYEKAKEGRHITEISFTIQSKEVDEYMQLLEEMYDTKDFKKQMGLENENFSKKQIINLYEKAVEKNEEFSIEEIFKYIRINYLYMKEKGRVKNPYSYLMNMLDHDFGNASVLIKYEAI